MTNVTFKNVKTSIEISETDLHILFRAMKDYKNKVKVVADEFPVHYVNVDTMLDMGFETQVRKKYHSKPIVATPSQKWMSTAAKKNWFVHFSSTIVH